MQIYLIRHPQPSCVDGLCYGRLDVGVERQVLSDAADSVLAHIPRRTLAGARLYSSPSSRCSGLARHLAAPREPILAEDLAEMSFGDWEGKAWDAIPREQMDSWTADVWGYRPGGGESAEMVAARWERWVQQQRKAKSDGAVVVTHAGVIRVALARSGLRREPLALEAEIPFGSVHCLDIG